MQRPAVGCHGRDSTTLPEKALTSDASALLRHRLIEDLNAMVDADQAARWAKRSIPEKNKLTAIDARRVEESTGPISEEGKLVSRCNAVRHGLTAETVIGTLEDVEDYRAFEAAIIADYDAQSAVERELVLRLASLLWRLRRATALETGLFEIQADGIRDEGEIEQQICRPSQAAFHADSNRSVVSFDESAIVIGRDASTRSARNDFLPLGSTATLTECYLRLADLPNYALDRLSRYEATLSRQVARVLLELDALERRKPQERRRAAPPQRSSSHRALRELDPFGND